MPNLGGISRDQLQRVDATQLPRLLRQLVLETTPGLVEVDFPADQGVYAGGWDGIVQSTESTPWVPDGLSLWEIAVRKSGAQTKANDDYGKGTPTPDGSPSKSATYVALVVNAWENRHDWEKDRNSERRWRRVRAFGLDDLHTWLEAAPVTHAWLAKQMGYNPYGYRPYEQWWRAWASQTNPRLTYSVVLAGRVEQAERLVERLREDPQVTTLHGVSVDEACAFVGAAVAGCSDKLQGQQLLAQMAVVDDPASWRELLAWSSPLVLVPTRYEFVQEYSASSLHHVVVPITHGPAGVVDIRLPRLDAAAVAAAFREAGMDDENKAKRCGYLARRSLQTLRRDLALNPALLTPDWAKAPVPKEHRVVLLAGRWADDHAGDHTILSELAGEPYETLREVLDNLKRREPPLVMSVDDGWYLVSPDDAWLSLGEHLAKHDLDRLKSVSLRVLGERNPALDLELEKRWMANVLGRERAYSPTLRDGLARTLVLLSLHGDRIRAPSGCNGVVWASHIVRELLPDPDGSNAGDLWVSLKGVLPLLAEAAPDVFITAIREACYSDATPLAAMFTDPETANSFQAPHSPHIHLLWALERLAWSPPDSYFVADILAALSEIDPFSRSSGRPLDSLVSLFSVSHSSVAAPLFGSIDSLNRLRKHHPDTAWLLIVELIRTRCFGSSHFQKPRFRNWETETTALNSVYNEFATAIAERAIEDAGADASRFGVLIEELTNLFPELRSRVVNAIESRVVEGVFSVEGERELRSQMLAMVRKHRTFPDAGWALPESEVRRIEEVAGLIEIHDPVVEHLWLFEEDYPTVPGVESVTSEHDERLAQMRRAAVVAVYEQSGLDDVSRLITESSQLSAVAPWAVGTALHDAFGAELESPMLDWLAHDADANRQTAQYYLNRQFRQSGWAWLQALLDCSGLTDRQRALLLHTTPREPRTWDIAAHLGPKVESQYWELFKPYGLGHDFEFADLAAERLTSAQQSRTAVEVFALYGIKSETAALLAAQALESPLAVGPDRFIVHSLRDLLQSLNRYRDAIGGQRLAAIEWFYLPAFHENPPVETLHLELQQNPGFFVEIVSMAFLPHHRDRDNDEKNHPREGSDRERNARNAMRLLKTWTWTPTSTTDDSGELSTMRGWVNDAIEKLRDADRLVVGEQMIGQMLGSITDSTDNMRPAKVVRYLLEEIRRTDIETGVYLSLINSRDVTCRIPGEGGNQEATLAAEFRDQSQRAQDEWPITAHILGQIADRYDHEASSEDGSAERFRTGIIQ